MHQPYPELELHRHGFALVPEPGDATGATALYLAPPDGSRPQRSCTCAASKKKTACDHLRDLSGLLRLWEKTQKKRPWLPRFTATAWYRLGQELWEEEGIAASRVQVQSLVGSQNQPQSQDPSAGGQFLVTKPATTTGSISPAKPSVLVRWLEHSPSGHRFLERLGKTTDGAVDRSILLERLALFQLTKIERLYAKKGMQSRRQDWEESLWYRLAYHCVREYGGEGRFHPAVDTDSGDFILRYEPAPGRPILLLTVPRSRVQAILAFLEREFPDQDDLSIHPVPLRSLFHVSQTTELDLEIRPMIEALQASGEARVMAEEELARFRYGNLFYLPDLGILAEVERQGRERKFKAPKSMRLARSQVPAFLAAHAGALAAGELTVDEPLQRLRIAKSFTTVEITPERMEEDGYSLSVQYGFGDEASGTTPISLADILRARSQGLPYLETETTWVDLRTPALRHLDDIFGKPEPLGEPGPDSTDESGDSDQVPFSLTQLLRFRATLGDAVSVAGEAGDARKELDRLFALRPTEAYSQPPGLRSSLRRYQELGVDWLSFLWENGFAGLLCDDMGLGKTHQAMALMARLRHRKVTEPFLVVCPTSVLSHWRTKILDHAPGLKVALHHGSHRNLAQALANGDVLVTSYGVLRRDVEALRQVSFAVAFFDEIQQLKNQATLSYEAARRLTTRMAVGLTGTPIENSLMDLKALFDLLLPGYLGSDGAFVERYLKDQDWSDPDAFDASYRGKGVDRQGELRRLTAPFILRRLKASVLDELPEKIEDVQTCSLSDQQVTLYREVIKNRGKVLTRRIEQDKDKPLPYIHVFAVLSLLKQICNHPALAKKDLDRADTYSSGKWDLYQELLGQALGNGQKVVVFTQYLGMITLMARHLEKEGVGHAILTGQSRDRGAIIERFNTDPDCRVFLGSLKAGGTGIDLVGGSVVIHYDRWWNAAREDQATDRVHRIGQKNTVQVFKLVTEGTLEEKISDLIDRKRRLMESVVQEDDPTLAKIFTREELLELLQQV